eukprot:TRINITY_DN87843_c0_g1_i1.p1 TRINITY_DN87843_c0_g1~~TRINITY_DN87843_c0_g1_i1.p1  ORF type:complete len:798 (+),score=141.58 TRINITY_DN87843_c0_g1_i1:70-2463(+)
MGNCQCTVAVTQIQDRDKFSQLESIAECDGDLSEEDLAGAILRQEFLKDAGNHALYRGAANVWPARPTDDDDPEEELVEPPYIQRARQVAVFAEQMQSTGYYKEPFWNKHISWERQLFVALESCPIFRQFTEIDLSRFVRAMEIHLRHDTETLVEEGEPGDGLFVVLIGTIACYKSDFGSDDTLVAVKPPNSLIDEGSMLYSFPRPYAMKAQGECVVAKFRRTDYIDLGTRAQFYTREKYKMLLKGTKMLEMMEDEGIAKLADILQIRHYEKHADIIRQGEEGKEFFIMLSGTARVWVKTADDEQEYLRYQSGQLFGELALMKNAPRAANVSAVTSVDVLAVTRDQFERLFGPMADLQQQQYLTDPRKLIADFYSQGDSRGPAGSLRLEKLEPEVDKLGVTTWFAIYRPTSKDAIAKMLSGAAVGKGLNVKGKSAKKGVLSGYVPFVQISDNEHRNQCEQSPSDSRVKIYYKTKAARQAARKLLQAVLDDNRTLSIDNREILDADDYKPDVFGLDMPEALIREAYIIKADQMPVMGWETGRRSEPFLMDANMHAIRGKSDPQVCLYQFDESEPLNPRGLLIAYAEKYVKPVVSDFDTFTVGAKGMQYECLPNDQAKIIMWLLARTREVLSDPDHNPWMSRWIQVIEREAAKGWHPETPKYGFGDPTSYKLIGHVVQQTSPCGAVRHGAECCNFGFPQDLDEDYLLVWHGFPDKPWDYNTEPDLRKFLLDRIQDGHQFPINPVWPVRDKGWFEIFDAMRQTPEGLQCLKQWLPEQINYEAIVDQMRKDFPDGFKIVQR